MWRRARANRSGLFLLAVGMAVAGASMAEAAQLAVDAPASCLDPSTLADEVGDLIGKPLASVADVDFRIRIAETPKLIHRIHQRVQRDGAEHGWRGRRAHRQRNDRGKRHGGLRWGGGRPDRHRLAERYSGQEPDRDHVYDTSGTQVGGFNYLASQPNGLAELAGTANGFVLVYAPETGGLTTTGLFIPTSASGPADAGTFPTYTISIPGGTALGLLAISDDVGTGGAGGVGLALMGATSTSFAYVHADGTSVGGPVSVFGVGYQASFSQVSLTNINGSFVMSVFELTVNAGNGLPSMFTTLIAASGCD